MKNERLGEPESNVHRAVDIGSEQPFVALGLGARAPELVGPTRPVRGLLLASLGVAIGSCVVSPVVTSQYGRAQPTTLAAAAASVLLLAPFAVELVAVGLRLTRGVKATAVTLSSRVGRIDFLAVLLANESILVSRRPLADLAFANLHWIGHSVTLLVVSAGALLLTSRWLDASEPD